MAQQEKVNPSVEPTEEDKGRMTTPQSLGFVPKEIEVDSVTPTRSAAPNTKMYEIRVNQNVEEMSWVHQGRRESYSFEVGHRYMVPAYIANELEACGRLWH